MARPETETETPVDPRAADRAWKARPVAAWLIRAVLFGLPLAASWMSVRLGARIIERPSGLGPTIVWVIGAVALSVLVYKLARRALNRFSSLGVLFTLSLTFPDAAPSRMRAAFRSGRTEELQQQLGAESDGALEPKMKAKRMADLVTEVGRREALTRGHSDRVRGYAELIGAEIGLDEEDINRLRWATLLHDVGLLDVPVRILDKRGPLDADERAVIEQHPVHGARHLAPFSEWLGPWALAASDHHERWDGTGYPAGLAGEEISLAGRIVAVADAYDAMTANRSYQKAISPSAARQELVDNAGSQFDPTIVRAFLNVGIRESRAGLGPLAALVEVPRHIVSLAPAAAASAGVAAAGAVAVVAGTVVPPAVSTDVELPVPVVERLVEETDTTSTVLDPSAVADPSTTTSAAPTTSRRSPTTTAGTTTTGSSTTTTTAATTTTTATVATTTTTTVPPTAPPTVPTTTVAITTTTVTVPAYPTVTLPTITYPTIPL